MKVHVLMDNKALDPSFESGHGLSFGIETAKDAVVFDFGPDDRFLINAKKTGFPLERVTHAILSHGHYDHAGGLLAFHHLNPRAQILMSPYALEMHYSAQSNGDFKFIGIDERIAGLKQVVYVERDLRVAENQTLMASVERTSWNPSTNLSLFTLKDGVMEPDDFCHEIHLVIVEDEQLVLFMGCGHGGIINVFEAVKARFGRYPTHAFGGLHLHSPSGHTDEHEVYLKHLGDYLKRIPTQLSTGHCTGEIPYAYLRALLRDQIHYAQAGCVIDTQENTRC